MIITKEVKKVLEKTGISKWTVYRRLQEGWTLEEAINLPLVGAVHIINGKSVFSQLSTSEYQKFLRYYSKTKDLNTAFTKAREK
jgi:hypothetical protein